MKSHAISHGILKHPRGTWHKRSPLHVNAQGGFRTYDRILPRIKTAAAPNATAYGMIYLLSATDLPALNAFTLDSTTSWPFLAKMLSIPSSILAMSMPR